MNNNKNIECSEIIGLHPGELKLKSYISEGLLEKLRSAVISSPLIDNELKKIIS